MVIEQINTAKKQSGFGILEVLIAMIVLAFMMTALSRFQVDNRKFMLNTEHRNEAMKIAKQVMDSLQEQGLESVDFAGGRVRVDRKKTMGRYFAATYTVARHDSLESYQISKKVNVTVSWPSALGNTQQIDLDGVIE